MLVEWTGLKDGGGGGGGGYSGVWTQKNMACCMRYLTFG